MVSTIKKIGFAVLITVMGALTANAQNSNPKVIALLNKASWCPVCQANGPRVEKDLMPMLMKNKEVMLVMNDVSNKESKAMSKPMLEKAGVVKFAKNHKPTGVLYFINAKSKKLISSISIAKSNEEIMMAFKKALAEANNPAHGQPGHVCDASCKSKM